jgi:hypothetical protein
VRIRQVLKEFEAHLHALPTATVGTAGKSEWKHYGDDTYRFKVTVRNIALPDDSRIDLVLDGLRIASQLVSGGKATVDVESQLQAQVPKVQAGQRLQVRFGDTVLAEGIYVEE